MLSTPHLQCLFCHYRNPAGARFCNDCGSQLDLQPCNQCGAVDKRTASNCYKCGAVFSERAAAEPAASELAIAYPRPIAENPVAFPVRNDVGVTIKRTSLPGTAALEPQDATVSSESGPKPPRSRRRWRVAVPAFLFAAVAISAYYYDDRSAKQLGEQQRIVHIAPSMSSGAISGGTTASSVTTQLDAAPAQKDTRPILAPSAEAVDKAQAPAAPVAAKPRADPEPVPADRPLHDPASISRPAAVSRATGPATNVRPLSVTAVEGKPRNYPPILKECSEAIAALGFCSQNTKQGNR